MAARRIIDDGKFPEYVAWIEQCEDPFSLATALRGRDSHYAQLEEKQLVAGVAWQVDPFSTLDLLHDGPPGEIPLLLGSQHIK